MNWSVIDSLSSMFYEPNSMRTIPQVDTTISTPSKASITFETSTLPPTTSDNPVGPSSNTYIIILATVIPVVLIAGIVIGFWVKKFFINKKISPSAYELGPVSTPLQSQA
jgi:hypothetical protein